MKRAYPQYLAAGGESLPAEVLRVLFPLDHWPLLESLAKAQGIDPYLVAALAAQESTFDAGIRSSAGAIGLMQIMPATGRGFARRMGITPFSTGRLTEPEINASIGTKYFADLMQQFGGAAYALAGYNAGEHRVVRWRAERPGLPVDEWIDDIPFPETQNYVKRILGTAEDYRRLYGGGVLVPGGVPAPAPTQRAAGSHETRAEGRRRPAPRRVRPRARRRRARRRRVRGPAPTASGYGRSRPRAPRASRGTRARVSSANARSSHGSAVERVDRLPGRSPRAERPGGTPRASPPGRRSAPAPPRQETSPGR